MKPEPEVPKHRKRAPKNKPFVVECYPTHWNPENKWSVYRRYTTLERAQTAVEALKKSHAYIAWDFRVRQETI